MESTIGVYIINYLKANPYNPEIGVRLTNYLAKLNSKEKIMFVGEYDKVFNNISIDIVAAGLANVCKNYSGTTWPSIRVLRDNIFKSEAPKERIIKRKVDDPLYWVARDCLDKSLIDAKKYLVTLANTYGGYGKLVGMLRANSKELRLNDNYKKWLAIQTEIHEEVIPVLSTFENRTALRCYQQHVLNHN